MIEHTFAMIKPDAVKAGRIGNIINLIEQRGRLCPRETIAIEQLQMIRLSRAKATSLYEAHIGKPFYDGLIDFTCSGPVVGMVLRGYQVIRVWREIMGATDPKGAAPSTIRGLYGTEMPANAVHGSDCEQSCLREMYLWDRWTRF